ncbi:hypothetical protein SH467x_003075 [Pirellulaceae bacterium SH467]
MPINKRVFHCAICGNVLHVHNASQTATCCGHPMRLAFEEFGVPSKGGVKSSEEVPSESHGNHPDFSERLPTVHGANN